MSSTSETALREIGIGNGEEGITSVLGAKELEPHTIWTQSSGSLTRSRKLAIAAILVLCFSIVSMSFGAAIGGGLAIGRTFGVNDPATASWVVASGTLTQGAFVLVTGRIGSVYGHKFILLLGATWWILWCFINGFCTQNFAAFASARAMTGIGAAFVMPNIVATIGTTFPPGNMRNYTYGFLGFGAPVAGTLGCVLIAIFIQFAHWRWFLFTVAILASIGFGALWVILPQEDIVDKDGTVDWVGACLGICSLVIFNFVWNQAPAVGWAELYIIILLPVSLGLFLSFAIWEYKFAKSPIMPLHVFKAPSFLPLILVILLTLMAYSTSLWYMVAFQQNVRHWSPLHFAVGLSPHAVFGALAAPVAAWLIPRLAAQWILAFGCLTVLLSAVVLATMPEQQSYWIQVFPATILMSVCSDFILTAAQIIAAGAVSRKDQGVAASLVSVVQSVGAGIGLGVAGTVEAGLIDAGRNEVTSYRGALWLAAALAAVALPIDFLWVRVVKDERVGWGEDVVEVDARIKREATA